MSIPELVFIFFAEQFKNVALSLSDLIYHNLILRNTQLGIMYSLHFLSVSVFSFCLCNRKIKMWQKICYMLKYIKSAKFS